MSLAGSNYTHTYLVDPPGSQYCAFVGAFTQGSTIYLGFSQALGNTDPTQRAHMPDAAYTAMGTTYANYKSSSPDGAWDFWGMTNTIEWLKSTDHGLTFTPVRSESTAMFPEPGGTTGMLAMSAVYPQATIRLPNGDWLRRINGEDEPYAWNLTPNIPKTCYIERQVAGAGPWIGAGTAGAQSFLALNSTNSYQISRFRVLSNGALIATGQNFQQTAGSRSGINYTTPLIHVSTNYGYAWTDALTIPANWTTPSSSVPQRIWPAEGDTVELANGDLLQIWRTGTIGWSGVGVPGNLQYAQVRLTKTATNRWSWGQPITWPAGTEVGGGAGPTHPELLKVRTGDVNKILFLTRSFSPALSAFYYTEDEGATWSALSMSPAIVSNANDPYYPRAVVTYNGLTPVVNVFGHYGYDNYIGEQDNKIVQHRFTLPNNTYTAPPGMKKIVKIGGSVARLGP